MSAQNFDCTVIGRGSIALAIAFRLATDNPDMRVAVVGRTGGSIASTAAGAMLGCFGEVTKYTFANGASTEKFKMMLDAHRMWRYWIDEIQTASGMSLPVSAGIHVVFNAIGGILDEDNFDAMLSTLEQHNEPFDHVDPRDIVGLAPTNAARPLQAVFLPNEGSVDSREYISVLEAACSKRGVEFFDYNLEGAITRHPSSFDLPIGEGQLSSASIVFAVGSSLTDVLEVSALDIDAMPVFSGAGVAMISGGRSGERFEHTIRTSNRAGSCGLHLVPLSNGREYLGATNVIHAQPQEAASVGMAHFLAQCGMEQLNNRIFYSNIEKWCIGNRPVSLDTLPLIGSTSVPGVFIASGTYRDGFHCSPAIAQSVASEVTGGESTVSPTFDPERRPIELMTREDSVSELVLQDISWAHETGLHLPFCVDDGAMREVTRRRVEELYDRLSIPVGLHPDLLFYLLSDRDSSSLEKYLASLS